MDSDELTDTETSQNVEHWKHYYQTVKHNPHRPLVGSAAESNLSQSRLAVDCGCGTGSEIAFLLSLGYRVEAFDINPEAIQVCRERFPDNPEVNLHLRSFEDFHYPQAGLVIANSSLFFCNPQSILQVWSDIERAICPGGVFCGDFLGMKDSWVGGSFPKVAPLSTHQIERMFESFEILKWVERDEAGHTAGGAEKHWHSFTILARKG